MRVFVAGASGSFGQPLHRRVGPSRSRVRGLPVRMWSRVWLMWAMRKCSTTGLTPLLAAKSSIRMQLGAGNPFRAWHAGIARAPHHSKTDKPPYAGAMQLDALLHLSIRQKPAAGIPISFVPIALSHQRTFRS